MYSHSRYLGSWWGFSTASTWACSTKPSAAGSKEHPLLRNLEYIVLMQPQNLYQNTQKNRSRENVMYAYLLMSDEMSNYLFSEFGETKWSKGGCILYPLVLPPYLQLRSDRYCELRLMFVSESKWWLYYRSGGPPNKKRPLVFWASLGISSRQQACLTLSIDYCCILVVGLFSVPLAAYYGGPYRIIFCQ